MICKDTHVCFRERILPDGLKTHAIAADDWKAWHVGGVEAGGGDDEVDITQPSIACFNARGGDALDGRFDELNVGLADGFQVAGAGCDPAIC